MSTSVPLSIPLHFASSSQSRSQGPTLPSEWRSRWRRSDYPQSTRRPHRSLEGDDKDTDILWPSNELDRWVICMTTWEEYDQKGSANTVEAGPSALKIAVANEEGADVMIEEDQAQRDGLSSTVSRMIGSNTKGQRVALGQQDGVIWLFAAKKGDNQHDVATAEIHSLTRSESQVSVRSGMVSSHSPGVCPSSPQHAELEGLSSPTAAVISTSEVTASGSAARNSSGMEAEEKLETQWHAGRENHTVMGDMMEALGLQHSVHKHNHAQPYLHAEENGKASPPSPHRQSHASRLSKLSRQPSSSSLTSGTISAPSPTPLRARSRAISAVTPADQTDRDLVHTITEIEQRKRLSALMSSAASRRGSTGASERRRSSLAGTPKSDISGDSPVKSKAADLEAIATLQSPSSSPVVSLCRLNNNLLASLQEDGTFISWSLVEAIPLQTIDVRKAKIAVIEGISAAATGSSSVLHTSSSIPALATLRSSTATPATRSRANSDASQAGRATVDQSSLLLGTSRFSSMREIAGPSTNTESLLLLFDNIMRKVLVLDGFKVKVVASPILHDCIAVTPCAHVTSDGEKVEIYYLNSRNSIHTQLARVSPEKLPTISKEHNSHSPFHAASAFLRREGLSNANSAAPSIMEEKSNNCDLGNGGIKDSIEGLHLIGDGLLLAWTASGLHLLRRVGESVILTDSIDIGWESKIAANDNHIVVEGNTHLTLYRVHDGISLQEVSTMKMAADCDGQVTFVRAGYLTRCSISPDEKLLLEGRGGITWRSQRRDSNDSRTKITASLPFSMERIVVSLSSGHLVMCSLAELVAGKIPQVEASAIGGHIGQIHMLRLLVNPRTQVKHIVGGTEEGDIIFWDAATLQRQSQRSLFTSPVVNMIVLGKDDNTLRLNGCVACVAADGSLIVFLLDGMSDLFTIPGRGAPLVELAVRVDELLLIYEDGRARVWDMKTLELRRSIGIDQATALLEDGKGWWSRFPLGPSELKVERGSTGVLSSIPTSRGFAAGSVNANLRKAIEAAAKMVLPLNIGVQALARAQKDDANDDAPEIMADVTDKMTVKRGVAVSKDAPGGRKALHTLRPLLQCILPLGLDERIDELAKSILGQSSVETSPRLLSGLSSSMGHLVLPPDTEAASSLLTLSAIVTTARLLGLTAMLLVLGNISELQSPCLELLTLLGTVPVLVGESFQPPCLATLTDYITDSITEIQQAAKTLFTITLESMSQEDVDALCNRWTQYLPTRNGEVAQANKAVLLLGLIATERYTMLPSALLKEIANSIALFLQDDGQASHQMTAIILCDRGFTIFQHYFDAMEVVRVLFSLSTSKKQEGTKEDSSSATVESRNLARRATLRIAEDNTPLFMTTLSLDILHAQSPAHCDATMRLVALMVRRKPLILYPNLPRLAEAVVKSLDPTVTSLRTVVHRSATIIISELVATYPTISFHKEQQRLAVGTFEGAIIMYDLKTSTRLYVIEAHQRAVSGLSFSQDGRRLVSICLLDNTVKVWKTGVGFSSFLNFGGAPRQGGLLSAMASSSHTNSTGVADSNASMASQSSTSLAGAGAGGGSSGLSEKASSGGTTAYRRFEFGRIEEEGEQIDLSLVRFHWLGPRSIQIGVGETSMVFDVA